MSIAEAEDVRRGMAGAEPISMLRMPFISVAFVTALLLAPVVIVTGLLTSRTPPQPAPPADVSLAVLRRSFDGDLSLRHSEPDLR